MKRAIAVLVIALSATLAQAYTFDSWFDPVKILSCPGAVIEEIIVNGQMYQQLCVICPDKMLDVIVERLRDGTLLIISYRYTDKGIKYLFVLQGDHYQQITPKSGKNI